MKETPVLSEKGSEMIAVGASIAAGCVPCTTFHKRIAATIGIGSEEIGQVVQEAVRVRTASTSIMARHGGLSAAGPESSEAAPAGNRSLILELVAVGAAYAVSCTEIMEKHMAAARSEGATDAQVLAALKIACAVRDVAGQKAKTAAAAFFGADEAQAAGFDCSEGNATPAEAPGGKAKSSGGCSCGGE